MADQRIDQLNAETTPAAADVLPVFSIAASDTKKITVKNLVQQGVALVDDASIPVAKVNLSGINGSNLTAGTVTAAKLDTSTIPATGGVTVSSSNLQLVAPTSPIVRNAGTGSLEHATSGATAGTYTKVTVDTRGHVTVGAAIAAADLPIAVSGTVGVMSPGTGLSVTGGGVLNHTSSITAGTTTGFTYNAQGHITGAVALAGADLPIATSSVRGAVRPGAGLTVDGNGILDVTAATNAVLGGVIAGSDFSVSTGTISLAAQAGIAAGQYTKVTINSKGIATAGTVLSAGDVPNLAASQITSGSLDIARIAANTITGAKIANYAITKIGDTQPTADQIGQFFFNPLSRDLFLFDGNVYQPIGISVGEIVFAGTFDASAGGGTGHVASVTAEGTAIGLVEGSPLPAAATANNRYYLVVSEGGTITSGNAPNVALAPPDIVLSTGIKWTEVDVSQTFTSVSASQVAFTPEGTIAASNVQAAIEEVNNEKLGLAGGTVTGNLEIGTAGSLSFEGSTANAFETFIAVVDPTADRTITLPNITGTVITTGDTGTVTSTMLLDGTILNADINASAAIAGSKIVAATTSVVGAVQLSDSTSTTSSVLAATPTAVKAAYDLAAAALPLTGGTVTGNLEIGTAGSLTFEGATADAFELSLAIVDVTADRTITLPDATGTVALLSAVQSFSVAQRGTVSALGAVAAGTTTLDLATANNFSLSLPAGGTVTLANPSNQTAGQSGVVTITQNGTTAALVAYGGNWKFQSGAPSVSTTLSSVNVIAYYVESSSRITAQLLTNTIS
jgi:YD repeat-containing protein